MRAFIKKYIEKAGGRNHVLTELGAFTYLGGATLLGGGVGTLFFQSVASGIPPVVIGAALITAGYKTMTHINRLEAEKKITDVEAAKAKAAVRKNIKIVQKDVEKAKRKEKLAYA